MNSGAVDISFGQFGVTPIFGLHQGEAAVAVAVRVDSAARILVAGGFISGPRSCVLARLLPDGSRDASFGANGIVRQSIGNEVCWYNDVALQPDGKIVAFGEIDGHTEPRPVLARYNSDGTLDSTFGDTGLVVFEATPSRSGLALAIDAEDRILVAGDGVGFYTRRYTPDGAVDATFGTSGFAESAYSDPWDVAEDLSVQPDGKIVVAGGVAPASSGPFQFGAVRYNIDGTKDSEFGSMGQVTAGGDSDSAANGVVVDALGRTVLVGSSGDGGALCRLHSDGSIDSTFGGLGTGIVVDQAKPGLAYGAVTQDSNERLLVFGQSLAGQGSATLARYSASGARDPAFGSNGFAEDVPLSMWRQAGWDLAVQDDGRIVAVGGYGDLSSFDMFVTRYCP
jgi:uncharacterized delta-60 repeat protein